METFHDWHVAKETPSKVADILEKVRLIPLRFHAPKTNPNSNSKPKPNPNFNPKATNSERSDKEKASRDDLMNGETGDGGATSSEASTLTLTLTLTLIEGESSSEGSDGEPCEGNLDAADLQERLPN